jgi:hypothetical protein
MARYENADIAADFPETGSLTQRIPALAQFGNLSLRSIV